MNSTKNQLTNICRNFTRGEKRVLRKIKHYNLDVIISVGYRVKSKRGTQFRIWANKVLKDYLVQGYALNEKRLKEQTGKVKELEKSLEVFKRIADNYHLEHPEFTGIIRLFRTIPMHWIFLISMTIKH